MKLQSVSLLMIFSSVSSYGPIGKNMPSPEPSKLAITKLQDNYFPEMEFPASILESQPFYFKPKNEIFDPFSAEVKTVYDFLAHKYKSKPDSEQQLKVSDFIYQNSIDSLKLNENTELNIEKPLQNYETFIDNDKSNSDVDLINTQSFNNDTNNETMFKDKNSAQFIEDSAKHNESISDPREISLSQPNSNPITNSSYDAGTQLESADITSADDVDFKQGIDAVEVSSKNSDESSNLEELIDQSSIDKMLKETLKLHGKEEGEGGLTPESNSGINNYKNVRNDEIETGKIDTFDYMNLPEARKSEEVRDSTDKYEEQIPAPIISNDPTTSEVTSNYEPNQQLLQDFQEDNFEDIEKKQKKEEVMHPMSADKFISSQNLAATNTDMCSNENEGRNVTAQDVFATFFFAHED